MLSDSFILLSGAVTCLIQFEIELYANAHFVVQTVRLDMHLYNFGHHFLRFVVVEALRWC